MRLLVAGVVFGGVLAMATGCGSNTPSGGATPSTTCDATSCADGCCDSKGVCQKAAQQSAAMCGTGTGGGACKACGSGDTCTANKCQGSATVDPKGTEECNGTTCPGCCQDNRCIAISLQDDAQCGQNGAACAACASNQTCNAGACGTTTKRCDASAAGCCTSSGVELRGDSNEACGKNGSACAACKAGEACESGECKAKTPECTDETCPEGCCRADGTCDTAAGTTTASCGAGTTCGACSATEICTERVCIENLGSTTTEVGSACTTDKQCSDKLGAGFTCRKTTGDRSNTYVGGYCTKTCTRGATNACPASSDCVSSALGGLPVKFANGETDEICMPRCNETRTCRDANYMCVQTVRGTTYGNCIIDAPTPVGQTGIACSSNLQCGLPPGQGFCLPENLRTGTTGFKGNYCTAECPSHAYCSTDSRCVNMNRWFTGLNLCMKRCAAPGGGQSDCREGYVCVGETATIGVCIPNCKSNPQLWCQEKTCNADGYCR